MSRPRSVLKGLAQLRACSCADPERRDPQAGGRGLLGPTGGTCGLFLVLAIWTSPRDFVGRKLDLGVFRIAVFAMVIDSSLQVLKMENKLGCFNSSKPLQAVWSPP